jgi:hypothetical protein
MSKERQSHRETRKRPTMTLKEKRSAKKAKEAAKTVQGEGLSFWPVALCDTSVGSTPARGQTITEGCTWT